MAKRRKHEQKKREAQRATSGSVYRLAGQSGELVACYANQNWREHGMASLHILRRAPGGGHVMGAYLVDLGCMGLKDAWGRLDITYQQFKESILDRVPEEIGLVPVELALVRRLVAGGIRFAQQNGFRLPPRHERWVALLGDIGDWRAADLTDFGRDGRLYYTGTEGDLQQHLIGSVDEFLARKDVDFILGVEGELPPDEDKQAVEEAIAQVRERGLSAVRQYCFANGQAPHPRLPEAWDLIMTALMQIDDDTEDENTPPSDATCEQTDDYVARMLAMEDPASQVELAMALEQVGGFMRQFRDPADALTALGMDQDADDGGNEGEAEGEA